MRRSRRGLCVPHASVTLCNKCHPIHDTGRVIPKINSEEGDVGSSGSQCGLSSLRSAHRPSLLVHLWEFSKDRLCLSWLSFAACMSNMKLS